MNKKIIEEIANSFISWEDLYKDIINGDFSRISSDRIEIDWMIEHFSEKEDYEKCNFLKTIK